MPRGPKKKVRTSERRTLLVEATMTVGGGYWLMGWLLFSLQEVYELNRAAAKSAA
jgi:hypothetical protein